MGARARDHDSSSSGGLHSATSRSPRGDPSSVTASTPLAHNADASSAGAPMVAEHATNVGCAAAGYSYTINGSGYPANTTVVLWIADNGPTGYPYPPGDPRAQTAGVTMTVSETQRPLRHPERATSI